MAVSDVAAGGRERVSIQTAAPATPPTASDVARRLSIRLTVGRAIWIAFALGALTLLIAGIPARHGELLEFAAKNQRPLVDLGISANTYAVYMAALGSVVVVVHLLIAAVIAWRRPDDLMALFVSLVLVINGAINPLSSIHALAATNPNFEFPVDSMIYFGLVSGVALLYVFPTGRFVPAWTLPLILVWAVLTLPAIFMPDASISFLTWPLVFQALILLTWGISGIVAQVYRYTYVSNPTQRQQTKWAALGLLAAVVAPLAYFVPSFILPSLGETSIPNIAYNRIGSDFFAVSVAFRLIGVTGLTVAMLLFPISFAVAITRYRLWDVDVVVNRTLVYLAVTGSLAVIYVVSIALLGLVSRELVFRGESGQGNALVIVLSTLAIAVLFSPVRRRVQDLIDRRFYRQKYDAAKTLAGFSARVRDEVDLERLSDALVGVVREAIQPVQVSLWLREPTRRSERKDGARDR